MTLVLLFGACLLLSVVVSGTPARTVLSASLIFLVVGAFAARLGWVTVRGGSPTVDTVIDLGLFVLLLVSGAALRPRDSVPRWPLIGVGLVVGVAGVTLLFGFVVGLGWPQALIIGAALAPVGPLTGLGRLSASWAGPLRAESALTAGLSVPLLIVLLAFVGGQDLVTGALLPLVGGVALGVALPAATHLLLRLPVLRKTAPWPPLVTLAIALLVYAAAHLSGVNPYLAAFAGGLTLAWLDPSTRDRFAEVGDHVAALAGLVAVLVLGALLTPALLRGTPALAWVAVITAVIVIRPAATAITLVGTAPGRWALAAGWLAPTVCTSAILALFVLRSGVPQASVLYGFIAVCVVATVLVHAVTDVVVEAVVGSATWTNSAKPFSTK